MGTTTLDNGSAVPWWAWLLLLLLCALCLVAAAAAMYFYKKNRKKGGVKKTKRAARVAATAETVLAPAQASAPTSHPAAPASTPVPANYMLAAPARYVAAAPQVPLRTVPVRSVTVPMAEPVQAMPAYARQGTQAMALFDQLDSNHDGKLSRTEFDPFRSSLREVLDFNVDPL